MTDPSNHLAIMALKDLIRRANTDNCPTIREMYRQLSIQKAEKLGIRLEPHHFPVDQPSSASSGESTAGQEVKQPIPARLPSYPGNCPLCGRLCSSHPSWLGHLKIHR